MLREYNGGYLHTSLDTISVFRFFKVSENVGEVSKCQNLNRWFSLFTRFHAPKAPGLVRGLFGHYELLTLQWAGRPVTLGLLSVRKVYCALVCCIVLGFILAHEDEYVNGSNNRFLHFIWRVGKKQQKHKICKWLGEWLVIQHLSTHTCSTWNSSDPCFGRKGPCFKGFTFKNKGHLGSRYIQYVYIYICTYQYMEI